MPKVFTSEKQKIGEEGENVAVKFLMKHGFQVIERNYTKKWGEIDIVAKKDARIHFVEVKSVSASDLSAVSRVTGDEYRPEDNMHGDKARRMARTVETYLLERKVSDETLWQIDLVLVYLDMKNRNARVKVVKDIIL